tara:strand:- start:2094 stop:2273 length:180 start_codon:yes stop_codon:yes gene_type:complete
MGTSSNEWVVVAYQYNEKVNSILLQGMTQDDAYDAAVKWARERNYSDFSVLKLSNKHES